jgi:polyisoprenoid-binding protein YceI
VPLAVKANGFGPDPNGGQRAGFTATAQINRGDFGIDRWTGGGAVIGDKVQVSLKIETVLQQ